MAKGISEQVSRLLAAADIRNGFPSGTMASVMQQEVGGQLEKFAADPSAYHYGLDASGRRVAPHTGKVSTAFGPFGILDSTARDPGYGVKPLGNKTLEEQVRFASDYLAARSGKGGLVQGLAGYGEGAKYAQQVVSRVPEANPVQFQTRPSVAPTQVAAAARPAPTQVASGGGGDAWAQFRSMVLGQGRATGLPAQGVATASSSSVMGGRAAPVIAAQGSPGPTASMYTGPNQNIDDSIRGRAMAFLNSMSSFGSTA